MSDEKLREALINDFTDLYVKEFTTNWKGERLVRETEIKVMDLKHTVALIKADRKELAERIFKELESKSHQWQANTLNRQIDGLPDYTVRTIELKETDWQNLKSSFLMEK